MMKFAGFFAVAFVFRVQTVAAQELHSLRLSIEQKYHVTIEANVSRPDTWNSVSMESISDSELLHYLSLLNRALTKYPDGYLDQIGLKYIHIGTNLKYMGVNRSAVPDNDKGVLFLASSAPSLFYPDYYLVHTFHHELNHYAEYHLWGSYRYHWDRWTLLYDSANHKGGEYAYSTSGNWYAFDSTLTGFANRYATLGQEEDRSEVIAFFLTDDNSEHVSAVSKSRSDSTYFKKCDLLFHYYDDKLRFTPLLEAWNQAVADRK